MKITILNGSPRKGNTVTAINAFLSGIDANEHEIDIIHTDEVNVSPCKGCGACQCHKGCVAKDDSNAIVDRIVAADLIVFATPVYWWGMTAQLKTVLDKCYCKGAMLQGKKIGVLIAGGSPTDHMQYKLIREQFECMEEFLALNMLFCKAIYATNAKDLEQDVDTLEELRKLGSQI